jgi:hypothetical protein
MCILQTFQHTFCDSLFWAALEKAHDSLVSPSINRGNTYKRSTIRRIEFICKIRKIPYNLFWKFFWKNIFFCSNNAVIINN